jgi:hypothetical protein
MKTRRSLPKILWVVPGAGILVIVLYFAILYITLPRSNTRLEQAVAEASAGRGLAVAADAGLQADRLCVFEAYSLPGEFEAATGFRWDQGDDPLVSGNEGDVVVVINGRDVTAWTHVANGRGFRLLPTAARGEHCVGT